MAADYAVKVTVRNGRILRRMKELGIKSQGELVKLTGISIGQINALIALRRAPINKTTGDWLNSAYALSSALQVEPEELWSEAQRNMSLRSNNAEVYMDEEQIAQIASPGAGLEKLVWQKNAVARMLTSLPPRQQSYIQKHFFENQTFEEIAKSEKVTKERIRQVIASGLRKLKHPSRAKGIEDYVTSEDD